MATTPVASALQKQVQERESVVIRFAGDSGDGMQVTGTQFATESVLAGNDIGTLPDFPAEIRAPYRNLIRCECVSSAIQQ
jgi:2-oxoglutarate ferredoxin oxidoreductase subunit alpha